VTDNGIDGKSKGNKGEKRTPKKQNSTPRKRNPQAADSIKPIKRIIQTSQTRR